ncbi:hypothetical protein Nepgr_010721 [Nepenthes gracilis]|uniref:RNase H type-1 domain-containing protein n=1 Tax=Nepenthes gracilis TaxID=150966 RepID=A0AAD3XLP3_NEPGR|nr:hypothetical protein Nepgr_010721 [Nepenthes gracilis]
MKDDCGASIVLKMPKGSEIKYTIVLGFPATNNAAVYEVLLAGLRLAKECFAKDMIAYNDSELVVNHVHGYFETNSPQLSKYLLKVRELMSIFEKVEMVHIPREESAKANQLTKAATFGDSECLSDGTLSENAEKATKLKKTAGWYTIMDGRLCRRGFFAPYLRCLTLEEADYALGEVHIGICGSHVGGKNLVFKLMRTTLREPMQETLFGLYYGVEAVIPVEVGLPSLRVESFNPLNNVQRIWKNLDLPEEAQDAVRLQNAAYQQRVARYYNRKVKTHQFEIEDLVLRSIKATGKNTGRNKLSLN